MICNFNIGMLGHVDSGKTTLVKSLSTIGSTAAFDKNPQSQERGITLDLGFSALVIDTPEHLKDSEYKKIQITLVDCPGHASLIRTIIGGAQIIDLMILVIDATKGIQTQTAECLIIGEITCKHLIIALNKIDQIGEKKKLDKVTAKLRKVFSDTKFGEEVHIIPVSAIDPTSSLNFLENLKKIIMVPKRTISNPFLFSVDHCFNIKGKGTICTGTVLEGNASIGDEIEIPTLCEKRKIKSMQMFRNPVQTVIQGDRAGICLPNLNAEKLERGILAATGSVKRISHAIIKLNRVKYFKSSINSRNKFHISIGHQTIMAKITLFKGNSRMFDLDSEYEYLEETSDEIDFINCLLEFETAPLTVQEALVIGSKLDIDEKSNVCRIAFWGRLEHFWINGMTSELKIFKHKRKEGRIDRVVNVNELIVKDLIKKECDPKLYLNKKVKLSTGEEGYLDTTFGQSGKIRVRFLEALQERNSWKDIKVIFEYKYYMFNKQLVFIQ